MVDGEVSGLWRYGIDCDAGYAVGWTEGVVDGRLEWMNGCVVGQMNGCMGE